MISHFENTLTKQIYKKRIDFFSDEYVDSVEKGLVVPKYDSIFDEVDWTKEPIESLETLSKQRALQLREKYSYLILYFSAGSDSTTVLNIFVRHNIPIDEVIINSFSDIDDDRYNGQIAIDYLKKINYRGKVTVVNIDYKVLDKFINKQVWTTYSYFAGSLHTLNRFAISDFERYDLITSISRPTNTGHIYGEACPIIKVYNKKYYAQFPVRIVGGCITTDNSTLFYCSDDFPQIDIKQSHIIAKYWREHFPEQKTILGTEPTQRILYKSLIRDPWDTKADFQKANLSGLVNMLDPRSESAKLISLYKEKEPRLLRDYYSSIIKPYTDTKLYKNYKTTGPIGKVQVNFYLFDA